MSHYSFPHTHLSFSPTHLSFPPTHELTGDRPADHPTTFWRILCLVIPLGFTALVNLAVLFEDHVQRVKSITSILPVVIARAITFLGLAIIGIYAVMVDAWTNMEWVLFAALCILMGTRPFLPRNSKSLASIFICTLEIFIALTGFWFFTTLIDMPEGTQSQIVWKHGSRNVAGFIEGYLVINVVHCISGKLSRQLLSSTAASCFFWVFAPLLVAAVFVLSLIKYGPFVDLIGFLIAAIIRFIGAVFKKSEDQSEDKSRE